MHFRTQSKPKSQHIFMFNDNVLQYTDRYIYLGIVLQEHLHYNAKHLTNFNHGATSQAYVRATLRLCSHVCAHVIRHPHTPSVSRNWKIRSHYFLLKCPDVYAHVIRHPRPSSAIRHPLWIAHCSIFDVCGQKRMANNANTNYNFYWN